MKISISLAFLLLITYPLLAQKSTESKTQDTLVCIFYKANVHKDGYDAGGYRLIDMPERIALMCDEKKIRLVGRKREHYETMKRTNAKGEVVYAQGREGLNRDFYLYSIALWNEEKKDWEIVRDFGREGE